MFKEVFACDIIVVLMDPHLFGHAEENGGLDVAAGRVNAALDRHATVVPRAPTDEDEYGLTCEAGGRVGGGLWRDSCHAWDGRRWVWIGRLFAIRVIGDFVVCIGPHWYCTLAMLCVIFGVGGMYTFGLAMHLHVFHALAGVFCTWSSAGALLACALVDPGVLEPRPGAVDRRDARKRQTQYRPSPGNRMCEFCEIMQPRGCVHCEYCDVCVAGWDHHCPWMSKCIGYRNLMAFYTFLGVALSSLGYIVVVTVMNT